MSTLDDLFGPAATPLQRLANEQVAEDRDMLSDLVGRRKELGLTQAEVGERLGVTQAAIQQFERLGGDPRLSTIRRYSLAIEAMIKHELVPNGHDEIARRSAALVSAAIKRVAPRPTGRERWSAAVGDLAKSKSVNPLAMTNR